jgi:hypothetical protein
VGIPMKFNGGIVMPPLFTDLVSSVARETPTDYIIIILLIAAYICMYIIYNIIYCNVYDIIL